MCRDAALGDVVHLRRPNLDLDGPPFGADDRRVEALVAVRLRPREEVAVALRDRLVERGQRGVDAPAVLDALAPL